MKQTTYYSDNIYFENEKGQLSEYDNEFVKLDKSDKKTGYRFSGSKRNRKGKIQLCK